MSRSRRFPGTTPAAPASSPRIQRVLVDDSGRARWAPVRTCAHKRVLPRIAGLRCRRRPRSPLERRPARRADRTRASGPERFSLTDLSPYHLFQRTYATSRKCEHDAVRRALCHTSDRFSSWPCPACEPWERIHTRSRRMQPLSEAPAEPAPGGPFPSRNPDAGPHGRSPDPRMRRRLEGPSPEQSWSVSVVYLLSAGGLKRSSTA